mgnify:CR=1 FL=1
MKIILLDKIQRLGEIGDVVQVNSGYARNFLIPQKKAAFASDKNGANMAVVQSDFFDAVSDVVSINSRY